MRHGQGWYVAHFPCSYDIPVGRKDVIMCSMR